MRPWMAFLFGVVACTGTPDPPPKDAGPPTISSPRPADATGAGSTGQPSTKRPADAAAPDAFKLTPAGGERGAILVSGSSIQITGPSALRGTRKDSKRKYADASGTVAEVKYYDDGALKLRRADGTGLWKINRYAPEAGGTRFKVKRVVGNENVEHMVVTPESSGWRVDIESQPAGTIRRTESGFEVRASDDTVVLTAGARLASGALGLWLSPDINDTHRRILLAECLAAGL